MTDCHKRGCRNLETKCLDCGRAVNKMTAICGEWRVFEIKKNSQFEDVQAPYDGAPFLACVWGKWTGEAIFARHYDAQNRCPGKYDFFYITENPEYEGLQIKIEEDPFPITHWQPLPEPPND